MGMEDHKLRVLCTVAETKSFSKASEIIHLTQPAVSLQIQALEEAFETKLFDRTSSTVTLTPAGEILYNYAKQILGLYASIDKDIGAVTGLVKGSISVGASTTIGNYLLPAVVSDFMRAFPKIKIHLLVGNTKRILEFLKAGNLNLGLVEGEVTKYKVMTEKLVADELSLIVAPFHPWAKKKEVSINDVKKEPFIFREEGSGTRQVIEKYLAKRGITVSGMKISAVIGSTEAIKEAVENGVGVSIVSKWAVRKELRYGTISMLGIKEVRMLRDFSLIFNRNSISSYASDEFLSYLKSYPFEKLLP
ncbi:MAG: selenium metabolism-associated LysR family transcriptional regulator [Thermodesulfovibrionales bacterium]|nr:selenium metabolism-associated LysR family transcriptional regulator [Thermodesulfovibrionales bacterium]